jgi:hypothetical protein
VRHVENPNTLQGFAHVFFSSVSKAVGAKREFYAQSECFENIAQLASVRPLQPARIR